MISIESEEAALMNEISETASALSQLTSEIVGTSDDPRMFSAMLFMRLWGNHRGFLILWQEGLFVEAGIILRSGIEAAICLAANWVAGPTFVALAQGDALETLKKQIKVWREENLVELVKEGELTLRDMLAQLPSGAKPKTFDWKMLAEVGGQSRLYRHHRMLSGAVSHVTGFSLFSQIVDAEDSNLTQDQNDLYQIHRTMPFAVTMGATILGCLMHARMIGAVEITERATDLQNKLNTVSVKWAAASL